MIGFCVGVFLFLFLSRPALPGAVFFKYNLKRIGVFGLPRNPSFTDCNRMGLIV